MTPLTLQWHATCTSDPKVAMTDLDEFRTEARQWLTSVEIPAVPLDLEARTAVLRAWQATLYEAGWLGLAWSPEVGGRGLTPLHALVFNEELARAGAPHPIGLIGLEVVGPTIEAYGTEWQRTQLLPRLLSGEDIWCQGFSEPDAGSDLASLRTRADDNGDTFVVNGQKVWTSWAHVASWCALLVRTDAQAPKHRGISYLLVDMSTPGISIRPITQMTGEQEFNEVFFDDVVVPKANLVGALNDGWRMTNHTLGQERGSYAVRRGVENEVALGDAIRDVRDHLAKHSVSDRAADRLASRIGRAYVASRTLENQTRKTVARLVASTEPSSQDSLDKLLLNEVEQAVHAAVVELLGPLRLDAESSPFGLRADRWIHDHYYSRAISIYGGTSQIQRNIIAQRMVGLPRV
jgi:alkylation response protein AidB-like acyl-CoA dehydrogenase